MDDLTALSTLADPTRRRLYELVAAAGRPLARDEAAAATGIGRALAAYHLDRLAECGLLEIGYGRPAGRAGPGAGRPPKLYRRAERGFAVQVPARGHDVLAEVLSRAADADPTVRSAVERAAWEVGRAAGAAARGSLADVLRARGYEPFEPEPGVVRLRNCPFDPLARRHPESVCALNLALVRGILAGRGADPVAAELAPDERLCCVRVALPRTETPAPA